MSQKQIVKIRIEDATKEQAADVLDAVAAKLEDGETKGAGSFPAIYTFTAEPMPTEEASAR